VAVDAYHANDLNGAWPLTFDDLTLPQGAGQPTGTQPYLRSAPISAHYSIQLLAGGHVQITPSAPKTPPGDFDANNGAICDTVK
jgi:hypothetical protein